MDNNYSFQLLKNIMKHAFQTETNYLKPPYNDISHIPPEIRQLVWPNISCTDMRLSPCIEMPTRRLFIIKTNLNFYVIYFLVNFLKKADVISIGPFRSDILSLEDYFNSLEAIPSLSSKTRTSLLNYYTRLPSVSLPNIVNTITYIINTHLFFEESIVPIYIDYTFINECNFDSTDTSNFITEEFIQKMKVNIQQLLNSMIHGNIESSQKELQHFLSESLIFSSKKLSQCKINLHMINNLFQINLSNANIQYLEFVELYISLTDKIEHLQTHDELIKMAYNMCYTYCTLLQNNIFPAYPKDISNIINYIHLHLHEPLSLSVIAEQFKKKPSGLSTFFKQSTGTTLTDYIQQTRINRAIEYLHNTDMPVSEIALATGFEDFAYFSKIFKKHTGYSPKAYRELQIID